MASTLEESKCRTTSPLAIAATCYRAPSEAVAVARFSQWLATAGRDSLKEAEQDAQPLRRLNGLVETLIILSKLARRVLGDEAEQSYPQDQLLHRAFSHKWGNVPQRLYPQCKLCSQKQGGQVVQLLQAAAKVLAG